MASSPRLPAHLPKGSLILVAVSGGGDSVYLTDALSSAAPPLGLRLHLAHVNHGRRGDEDLADARLVADLAQRLGLGFSPLRLPAPVEGDHSLEQRLREGRLAALRAEAHRLGAVAIAFGHTADDAAETFLLMALRGSGPTGLGSLRAERWIEADGLWMLRPLIEHKREEIRAALKAKGLSWREDPTNEHPVHRRNRLRGSILPLLAEEEPAAVELLARSAHLCGEAADLMDQLGHEDMEGCLVASREGVLVLENDRLRKLSPARLAILLRVAWRRVAGDLFPLPPPGPLVGAVAARIAAGSGEVSVFADGDAVRIRINTGHTLLHSKSINEIEALEVMMQATTTAILLTEPESVVPVANSSQRATPMQSRLILPGGMGKLDVRVMERSELPEDWSASSDAHARLAFFDPLSIRRDLVLRTAATGETISLGKSGSKEISDALQEAGIPPELRARVAVLADDRGILWIPGVRRAASAYVTDRSKVVLQLQWIEPSTLETDAK